MTTDSNVVETIFKTKESYNECDHCQSVLSPAAYFVKLVETIEKYIPGHKLKERRHDLFELPLDCNSTNKTKLYLEIANEIMENNLNKKLGGNALEKLAKAKYPFNLPANFPLVSICAYLEKQGINLADVYKVLEPKADSIAESLGLSPEEYELITTPNHDISEVYGISKSELKNVEKFIAQTNIDSDKLKQLIDCYNRIDPTNKLSINSGTIDNIDQALGFLHRFIRLANKLNWSFDGLCNVLLAVDKNEIDANSLKEISRIKSLQEKLKKPLSEVCKLYSNASISIEGSKSEEDANNAAESLLFLQGVKESDLKKAYGIEEPSEPFKEENFDEFIARTGIKRQEVEWLLDNYKSTTHSKKAKKQEKISVKEQKFLHNFTQLAGQLKLLFGKLNTMIAELPSEFKLKDLVTNTDNSTILKKIWNISDNELISLVNYNDEVSDKIGKSLISEVHKQILLARLMNISTAEIVQILLQLNITDLNLDNIERIFELNNWLNNNSITIEQLNTLINSSALSHQHMKEINEIEEEIEKNQELEIRKRLDSLVSHAELAGEWKIQIEKILEESEIKKLKNREKLDALMNNSTLSVDCKTKIKGVLEELKSKEKLDSLINDSTLSEEYKIKEIIEKTENKKLTSKERLDALINDSTLSEKCKTRISEVIEERENLHNEIRKHFNISSDVLAAAHQFTEKQPTNLQLLRLESPNKNIVHDVGIIGNKAVFLGKSEVHSKNSVESSMREPRKNVAVATIGTKTIFFCGKKSENEYSRKIDIYDEEAKSWITEAASEARDSAAVAVVGNKAIFLGGNKDNRRCSLQVDVYDNGVWTKHTASEARSNASVAVVGEKAIFFGGKINKTRSSVIDIYNNGEWVNRTDTASEARSNASVAIIDTKVIFFGGSKSDNQCSSKVDIYDSKAEKWTTHTVSEARENASVAVVDGKAIFFGGKVGQTRSNKIDIYDAKTEKWIEVQHVASEARDMVQVAIVNKQAIFFGGNKGDQEYSKYIDVYDGATDSWKFTGEISRAHNNVSVAVIGTKAIFFTKEMNNRIAGQVYIYDSTGYSVNNSIAKNWTRRVAKENEMRDGLFAKITNSTKFSGKIDIYDNIAKTWKSVDVYKPSECTSIDIRNNKAILTCKNSSGRTYEETYSIDLSITYDAMIEELLNNVAVFTVLKLSAEDIKSITSHSAIYGLKATWTEKQIKTLSNHKALQDAFSGNELTLSQYTEWLRDSYDESKVTEKIAQLANWDKKLLNQIKEIDAFKKCFSKENHPIDSLLKIKSLVDMAEQTGIDGQILLELKDLHNLPSSTGWNKYNNIERKLRESLSYVEGVKEHLENQKRNILSNYMLYTYSEVKNKNMRGLYAFLLIDVEISDCSKISQLKAGLNSLQLYIHRCILGLEEGVAVNSELTEEMWDLLDNYREWEATKKIALYPENYLNPTLRKSATAEYKALQNTLMQGNLIDDTVTDAYIKYFEDFAQLVNLRVVDTYFTDNKLYILGRTQAGPYTYYYRIGNFEGGKTGSTQTWEPWQKIEVQIPVNIARIVHTFGRIFIFWLHKTVKEKQIEDVSINDSTLTLYYVFKKVDGSWSAQQKLPHDVKIDEKFEIEVRKCLDVRNWNKKTLEEYKGKKDEKVGFLKHNVWVEDRDIEEARSYFENEIRDWGRKLKEKVKESKDINEKFDGKLKVATKDSEILILSCENGFHNSKFILKEDLTSERSYTRYFNSMNSIAEAEKSIKEFYDKKKEEEKKVVTRQINEMQKKIDKKKARENDKQSELISLENKKDGEKRSKDALQSKVNSVEQDIKEKRRLWQDIENLKVKLNNLFPHRSSDSYEKAAERGNLRAVINNLKQELTQHKQNVESTNVELQQELITLETETATLINNIAKLATEETVDDNLQRKTKDIIKRLSDLQLQEAQLDPLEESGEKGKLRVAADNLKQKLALLKQSTESKKVELLEQLTELETKVTNLESEINRLQEPEKTIEVLKKEKGILEESIKQHEKEIKKLDDEIKKYEKEKEYLKNVISQLQKNKKEIEDGNNKVAEQERHKQLDGKRDKEIKLVRELIIQEKNDNVDQSKYKSIEIFNLINKSYKEAYIKGSEAILAPEVQNQTLDFQGFYGVYLWEIFFHIPTLVAYLFNQEQKFAEARRWYQYVFNPTNRGCNAWQFLPFKTKCGNSYGNEKCDSEKLIDLLDPYKEADKKKISYEKYVIMSYIDNLVDWGDMLFSQNSWEGINQATMLYVRAWNLLGEKPKKKGKFKAEPESICELSNNKYDICKIEAEAPRDTVQNTRNSSSAAVVDLTTYCSYFCTPENKDFIALWDRIEDRLYKIRHCLDIKGKRLELSLFQPPIDPRQLISTAASGSIIRLPKIAQVPHYRFKYMITYAKSIADTVTQIGSELLSVLEKKDAEALTLLYNKQEGIMANLMTTIKEKAIEALKEEAKALDASLSSAKDRKSHYEKLINDGLSGSEIAAIATAITATGLLTLSIPLEIAAVAVHLVPNIFGLACGGSDFGRSVEAGAKALATTANTLSNISQNISTSASYERRAQDWDLQKIMATYDTEQISHQIEANKINQANAVQDLTAHKKSIEQIKEKEQFFRSKFTNQELYSWMKGELKSLYIRVYRLALEIARQAEYAYQYEVDSNKTFIQPGHWNSLKEGLLSGQKLKFELEQLDKEYHDTNERRLEITKVISLKSLDPIALYELKTKGSCKFSFTEKLFDLDFPGHYARKIKDIKITIPAVVGPYENVHASLQQTSSQVILKSDSAINAIKYLVNPSEEEQPETDLLRVNWKPNQEIAISKADQDSGLFELSFGDERYLPFEGTGAVSTWELSLPQATNRFDIGTISDVIIHLDYTALNGGEALSSQVKNLNQLKYYLGTLVMNLSSVYPEEWEKFKQQAKGRSSELKFKLSSEIFPVHVKNPSVDLNKENNIYVIPTTPDMSRITIKLNNYNWERNSKKIVNPSLTIGSDWSIKINNADISKIEEIMIMVPYKATINW
ncbi:Tc toxin subunit A-related protein [Wolbachia endosymbiont (group B) of Chorthippus parallelus]|uniref:Tc toxin subunit A-related protein n=1 Tax=Wolbachia endosymbiont (group B) of Chorthippus parallelus TaxID=2953997 RepID=UPI00222FA3E3|nr:neuraminidase-like domain-containing protein [Wolbachia endosymbiont (group B) of Chorthippus parallelus]